jgi:hypothetical protein
MQRLIADERRAASGTTSRSVNASRAAERLVVSLSGWIGVDGCHALFSRGHAESVNGRRPANVLRLQARKTPYIAGVEESISKHGDDETADLIESMLATIIDLLGRLVDPEMAKNLIERSLRPTSSDKAGPPARETP